MKVTQEAAHKNKKQITQITKENNLLIGNSLKKREKRKENGSKKTQTLKREFQKMKETP